MANKNKNTGIFHDISNKPKAAVLNVLTTIVNRADYIKNVKFHLKISPTVRYTIKANPTVDQPGNGIVIFTSNNVSTGMPYEKKMVDALNKEYGALPNANRYKEFAKHMQQLFASNKEIDVMPLITAELYMLLIFETARRKVVDDNKSRAAKEYDDLPIEKAIENILLLMENGKCSFEDVILKNGKFHCFSGNALERKTKIDKIAAEAAAAAEAPARAPPAAEAPAVAPPAAEAPAVAPPAAEAPAVAPPAAEAPAVAQPAAVAPAVAPPAAAGEGKEKQITESMTKLTINHKNKTKEEQKRKKKK